jgi:hypothetical protein
MYRLYMVWRKRRRGDSLLREMRFFFTWRGGLRGGRGRGLDDTLAKYPDMLRGEVRGMKPDDGELGPNWGVSGDGSGSPTNAVQCFAL